MIKSSNIISFKLIKIITHILIVSLFVACNQLENEMVGLWAVDQAYYNDEPVIWDLSSNVFLLKRDNTCKLPISNYSYTDRRNGIWNAYNDNNKSYLKIRTSNEIFNRTFEVIDVKKEKDTVHLGYFLKIVLVSDSLKIECKKAM